MTTTSEFAVGDPVRVLTAAKGIANATFISQEANMITVAMKSNCSRMVFHASRVRYGHRQKYYTW